MSEKIIEAADLPEGEKVYLKKDMFGYRIVEPVKNEDGSYNWKRLILGTPRSRAQLVFYLMIVLLLYVGINELIGNYKAVAESPCSYCTDCHVQTQQVINSIRSKSSSSNVNLSNIFTDLKTDG